MDRDSFTLSDPGAGKLVMVKRNAELVWQLGGDQRLPNGNTLVTASGLGRV